MRREAGCLDGHLFRTNRYPFLCVMCDCHTATAYPPAGVAPSFSALLPPWGSSSPPKGLDVIHLHSSQDVSAPWGCKPNPKFRFRKKIEPHGISVRRAGCETNCGRTPGADEHLPQVTLPRRFNESIAGTHRTDRGPLVRKPPQPPTHPSRTVSSGMCGGGDGACGGAGDVGLFLAVVW